MNSITVLNNGNEEFFKCFAKVLDSLNNKSDYIITTDINNSTGIIVFSEKYNQKPPIADEKAIYIVSENSRQPLLWLSQIKKPAICCGMDNSCSVSISSICDNTYVVSVLRSLISPLGEEIEPMDMPVTTDIADQYAIMAATAAAMLLT